MKRIKSSYIIFGIILSIIICSCLGFYNYMNYQQSLKFTKSIQEENNDDELNVHYIDVGQSECILVTQGDESMLIDAGNNDSERRIAGYIMNQNISQLKYIIGTRMDEEHIGALDYVLNKFDVANIICPGNQSATQAFSDFINECNNKGLSITVPEMGYKFKLGDAEGCIFIQKSQDINIDSDYSMIIKIKYKDNSFLFEGSGQSQLQQELLSENVDLRSDVIKFRYKETEKINDSEFLEAVNPKFAVISGVNNTPFMKSDFKDITTFKTDINGTIVASSNGENISFSVEKIDWESWINRDQENTIPFDGKEPGNMDQPPRGGIDSKGCEMKHPIMDGNPMPKPPKEGEEGMDNPPPSDDRGNPPPPPPDDMNNGEPPKPPREMDAGNRPEPPEDEGMNKPPELK